MGTALLVWVLLGAVVEPAFAVEGDLDPTFGTGGTVVHGLGSTTDPYSRDDASIGVALQADGKVVASGYSGDDFAVARYTAAGDLDSTFGDGGIVTTDFGGFDFGHAVEIQSDGKIVVAGRVDEFGANDFGVARYNPDGSLDTTFSGDGLQTTNLGGADSAYGLVIQPDGRIVVVGWADGDGLSDFGVVRYNPDGTLDSSFSGDGVQTTDLGDSAGFHVALRPDGRLVVCGDTFADTGADFDFALASYNPDGTLDPTFSGDGMQTTDFGGDDSAEDLVLQPDGRIAVAGFTAPAPFEDGPEAFALARYDMDGSLDDGFSGDGMRTDFRGGGEALAIALHPNGKIVAAGRVVDSGFDFAVAQYRTNGSSDATFSGDGRVRTNFSEGPPVDSFEEATGVLIQGDSKIVAAGLTFFPGNDEGQNIALARYLTDGALDTTFDGDGLVVTDTTEIAPSSDFTEDIAVQEDDKILAVGYSNVGGERFGFVSMFVTRFNADGTVDLGFGDRGTVVIRFDGYAGARATSVAVQPDGRIIVAGVAFGETDGFAVARFLPDGRLDPSFSADGRRVVGFPGFDDVANDVALQPDGKIVLVGMSALDSSADGRFALARLNPSGALDGTFSGDGKQETNFGDLEGQEGAEAVAIQPNRRIVVVGGMGSFENPDAALARYRADGSLDPSFSGDGLQTTDFGGSDHANDVSVDAAGRIVTAGVSAPSATTGPSPAVFHYTPNGKLDRNFGTDGRFVLPAWGDFDDLEMQSGRRTLAAGTIDDSEFAIVRLLPSGQPDPSFAGDGVQTVAFSRNSFGEHLTGLAVQAHERPVVGGITWGRNADNADIALARFRGPDSQR